ncbi:hypothetical protein [Pseudomonas sp. LFM046]|uniref:hypothetical protein n=1 Tax=Pseudomonas sp. LFM046 TaxID=1608357 RepID=UPI0013048AC1
MATFNDLEENSSLTAWQQFYATLGRRLHGSASPVNFCHQQQREGGIKKRHKDWSEQSQSRFDGDRVWARRITKAITCLV